MRIFLRKIADVTRVFRISRKRRMHAYFVLVGIPLFVFWVSLTGVAPSPTFEYLSLAAVVLCLALSSQLFFPNVVFTESTVSAFKWNNRKEFEISVADLMRYAPLTKDYWALVANAKAYALPSVEYPELHAYILRTMPQIVLKSRWKCGQLPPEKDFVNMWMFEPGGLSDFIGGVAGTALGFLLLGPPKGHVFPVLGLFYGSLPRWLENFPPLSRSTPWASRTKVAWKHPRFGGKK